MVKKFMALVLAVFMGCCLCVGCRGYTKNGDYYELEADDMLELQLWHFTSGVMNNLIIFKEQKKDIQYDCFADFGDFREITTNSGTTIGWPNFDFDFVRGSHIDIIARYKGNIVGYAVIKITGESWANYNAIILKSAWFPRRMGFYQKVTQENVHKIIEEIKNKNK